MQGDSSPTPAFKVFRYRLYPNREQAATLNARIDTCCRFYNAALEQRRLAWQRRRVSLTKAMQGAELKGIRDELPGLHYDVVDNVLCRVDLAFKGFFRRVKERKGAAGFPRYRSVLRYDSLTDPHWGRIKANLVVLGQGRVRICGVEGIRVCLHRPITGIIKTATVKREAGRWYVTFVVAYQPKPLPASAEAVGLDVGVEHFATLSDGTHLANPRHLRCGLRALRVAGRRVSRRKRGSNARKRAVQLLQRVHAKVRNQRKDYQHKVARSLVHRFGLIAVEDLQVASLVRRPKPLPSEAGRFLPNGATAKGGLNRSIGDAAWGQFLTILDAKAAEAGRQVVRVNPRNTSQACSGCGVLVPKPLSQRWHACPECGLSVHRDYNSALNILAAGRVVAGATWPVGVCVPAVLP